MTKYKNYLHDLGMLIKEIAVQAKENADKNNSEFADGYLAGFHRIVSLMQQQAEVFNISVEEIGLSDIDPDSDLV